jgi:putative peptide zinc metalloprotease protein
VSDRFAAPQVGNQQTVTRRLLGLLMATLLSLGVGLPMAPVVAAQDNSAEAVNTKDGKSVFKLAFQVKKTMDSDVDATNSAIAFASCEDCKTVAGAIQLVLVTEEPTSVDAENTAVAINYQCTECETLAAAYQFVFGTGEDVKFTPEGKRRLNELKQEFKALKHQDDLTLQQLATAMALIAREVVEVVDNELVVKETGPDPATESTTTSSSPTTSMTVDGSSSGPTTTADESTTTTSSP